MSQHTGECVRYLRKSKGRTGIARQRTVSERHERELGLVCVAEFVDVDRTAYQRVGGTRPRRDGYADMLATLRERPGLTVSSWHADRLNRSSADVEELIEVCAPRRIPVETARGGRYELWTATGRKRIRQDAVDSAYEVDHLIERITEQKTEAASLGLFAGGRRPFGFEANGITHREDEAAEIRKACEDVLSGVSLGSIERDWEARGIRTTATRKHDGKRWGRAEIAKLLMRPRNAGLRQHQGKVLGEAVWEPIVSREQWDGVCQLLSDPARNHSPGNTPRWLGSGIYLCGVCNDGSTVRVSTNGGNTLGGRSRQIAYRCKPAGHLARNAAHVDEWVELVIGERLSRPDAKELLRPQGPGVDVQAIRTERATLQQKVKRLAAMCDADEITLEEYRIATRSTKQRLAEIRDELARAAVVNPLSKIVGADDPRAAFADLDLAQQRDILAHYFEVTLLPAPRGRRPGGGYFDTETVRITPKH